MFNFIGDSGVPDVDGSHDTSGALIICGDIVTGIIEKQHVLPPLIHILLEDIVLSQLLTNDLLSCVLDQVMTHCISAIFPIIETMIIVTVGCAS